MLGKQTIRDIKFKNQIVLVRVDYNVPIENQQIIDDFRIRASLPTLKYLLKNGARKLILISHLGRPAGRKNPALSLRPVAVRLQALLPNQTVQFVDDVSGPEVESAVRKLPKNGILLLENLRFYAEEEQNSSDFAAEIVESTHAQLFVQDGFAVVHRAHSSTTAITELLPSVAGLLLEQEITVLSQVLDHPKRPLVVMIGGAKVDDKQGLIAKFAPLADHLIVAGKIAADGYQADFPNVYVAEDFITDSAGQPRDIGPKSIAHIQNILSAAHTVIWNGPLGQVEQPEFAKSSISIAQALSSLQNTTTLICGGDTTAFIQNLQTTHPELKFTLISTGGGAALEFLSGLPLPGLDSLEDK